MATHRWPLHNVYRYLLLCVVLSARLLLASSWCFNTMTSQARTFHRRPLPSTCTALSSEIGRARFESALKNKGLKSFFPLIEQFTTQSEPAYCGISTLVMILNALSVDPRQVWKAPWRWYEESMLNCCISLEQVKKTGISMNTFVCLGRCQGLQVEPRLASEASLKEFRLAVERACLETEKCDTCCQPFLVVTYSRKVLKQTGDGHFSPVAAYDKDSDQVLILDTARFKYGPHWVPLELLYDAMQPVDPDTQKSRGFVMISFTGNEHENQPPRSILFRSRNLQNQARLEYKNFLGQAQQPVSWSKVFSFWTKNGTDPSLIWQAVQLQNTTVNGEEEDGVSKSEVEAVLGLVRELMPPIPPELSKVECHGPSESSRCQAAAQETIFIMYLASLSPESREDLVFNDNIPVSNETKQQLLAEAELLQYAIDVSDEIDCVSGCKTCKGTNK